MAFTLTKDQSDDIKEIVRSVLRQHSLDDACEDIYLFPDENYDGDNVLRIVITISEQDASRNGYRSDAIMDLLGVLSPYLLHSPNNAFPVPYMVSPADSPNFISEMVDAAAA